MIKHPAITPKGWHDSSNTIKHPVITLKGGMILAIPHQTRRLMKFYNTHYEHT